MLSMIRTCCACWLPIQATRSRLAASEPTIAPTVFAAYTPPTRRAGSWPVEATDAFKLTTEPYVFVVGADGKVSATFELVFSPEEIEAAIQVAEKAA